MNNDIQKAIQVLKDGGIVIFPTDTAFGIGCRIDNEKAIERLFNIRKRPKNQPVPVLVDSIAMAQKHLLPIPKKVSDNLMKKHWPGALTIILQSRIDKVSSLVRGGGNNLGVRVPNSEITLSLIKGVGVPILGPSANFHGEKTPYKFEDLDPKLVSLVDYVVPSKVRLGGKPSTVIDCSIKPWRILREGAIEISKIKNQKSKINETILWIDTSSNEEIIVGLRFNQQEHIANQKIVSNQTHLILSAIDSLLKENKASLKDLNSIEVQTGKGSLTGIRVGMAIANVFSFLLKIPVFGKMN